MALLGFSWLAAGCDFGSSGGSSGPSAGSESHFLERCGPGDCGTGLECLCGVCTRSCVTDDACGDLEGDALCLEVGGGGVDLDCSGSSSVAAVCAVGCIADAECEGLGSEHTCEAGVCTAPLSTAPVGGSGGGAGASGAGGSTAGSGGAGGAGGADGGSAGTGGTDGRVPFQDPDCTLDCARAEVDGQSVCECAREAGECAIDADCATAGNWGSCCPGCTDAYPKALVDAEVCLVNIDEAKPSGCAAQVDGCAQGATKPPTMCPDLNACLNAPYAACVSGRCMPGPCPEGKVQALGRCFPGCKTNADCAWATLSSGCCDACPAVYPAQALDAVKCLVAPGDTVPDGCRPDAAVCAAREAMNGPCSPQTCTTPALECQPDGTCLVMQ